MNTQSNHYAAAVLPVPVSAYSQTTGCFMLEPCVMRLPPRRSLLQSLLSPVSLLPEYVVLNVARTTGGTKLCRPATQTAHTALQQPHGSPMPLTPAIQVNPCYEYLATLYALQGHHPEVHPALPLREPSRKAAAYTEPLLFDAGQCNRGLGGQHSRKRDLRRKLLKAAQLSREHQTRKAG